MMGFILVVIAVAVFFWYKKKKQNETSAQSNVSAQGNTSAQNNVSVQSNSLAPFKNKAEKQYYEMAYGLLSSSVGYRSLDDVRRFVEFHTECVEVLSSDRPSKVVEKFFKEGISCLCVSVFKSDEELTQVLTSKGVSADQIEQIIKLNKSLDESLAYRYLPEDADKICNPKNYKYNGWGSSETVTCKISKDSVIPLKDQPESVRNNAIAEKNTTLQDIEKECKEVFDRCSSCKPEEIINAWYKCLERRKKDYEKMVDGDNYIHDNLEVACELSLNVEKLFYKVIYDNYFDNIKCVLVDSFNDILSKKRDLCGKLYGADKYMMIAAKQAAAITLRALNYEKHAQNKEKYSNLTKEICLEFISNHEIFKSEDDNEVADNILSEISIDLCGDGRWYLPYVLEDYHMDAVCNAFWKSVSEKYQEGDSADPNYIFNLRQA